MTDAALFTAPVNDEMEPHVARIEDLPSLIGYDVIVNGWLNETRRTRQMRFMIVRDRTGTVQSVCRHPEMFQAVDNISPESAICISGQVRRAKVEQFGATELEVNSIRVLSQASPAIARRALTPASVRFIEHRSQKQALLFGVRTTVLRALREYLLAHNFFELHTPKTTLGGSESGAALFEVSYFNRKACLVQSPQFYMQMAMAAGLEQVFEVGPVFRAEQSATLRHATEFTCLDVEMSWVSSHAELMDFEEAMLREVLREVQRLHGNEIKRHFGMDVEVPEHMLRITFHDALKISKQGSPTDAGRLTFQAEQDVSKWALEQHGFSFVFITDYPASTRPFYTMKYPIAEGSSAKDPVSRSFDLIWRGLEITSGCQREHDYTRLRDQAIAKGIEASTIEQYLDPYYMVMFQHGCPPHGGFGIGIERFIMALLGCRSIEDASFVFRSPEHIVP